MLNETLDFQPTWTSPPGDTILEIMDEQEISIEEFSKIIGESIHISSKLLQGEKYLTHEIAEKLSIGLGSTANFWIKREREYRGNENIAVNVSTLSKWVKELPTKEMKKLGWIVGGRDVNELISQCLEFFGVYSLQQWNSKYRLEVNGSAYRQSAAFNSCEFATMSWLRQGEIMCRDNSYEPWNQESLLDSVETIKKLTWFKDPNLFIEKLTNILASSGVAFSVVKAPKGCTVSGATRILENGTPHIQVSFRFLSDDHFWFTIFHEIAHLMLHVDKMPFYEIKGMELDQYEREANDFAASRIVPLNYFEELCSLKISRHSIIMFAKKMGIAPGLIVGQMQHLKLIGYHQMNFLKRRYSWID